MQILKAISTTKTEVTKLTNIQKLVCKWFKVIPKPLYNFSIDVEVLYESREEKRKERGNTFLCNGIDYVVTKHNPDDENYLTIQNIYPSDNLISESK